MSNAWLITGASSGFGLALAERVLARDDRAILTATRWSGSSPSTRPLPTP